MALRLDPPRPAVTGLKSATVDEGTSDGCDVAGGLEKMGVLLSTLPFNATAPTAEFEAAEKLLTMAWAAAWG